MGLREEIEARHSSQRQQMTCGIRLVADQLDEPLRTQFLDLANDPEFSSRALSLGMRERGYEVSQHSIQHHRHLPPQRVCQCPPGYRRRISGAA